MSLNNRTVIQVEKQISFWQSYIHRLAIYKQRLVNDKNLQISRVQNLIDRPNTSLRQKDSLQRRIVSISKLYDDRIAYWDNRIKLTQDRIDKLRASIAPVDPKPKPRPIPVNPIQSKILADQTKIAHDRMMMYLKSNYGVGEDDNNFIIPFVPQNFNLRMDSIGILVEGRPHSQDDWDECYYPTLGLRKDGSSTFWMELYGYFSAKNDNGIIGDLLTFPTKNSNILTSGTYVAKRIDLPPKSILSGDGDSIDLNYNPNTDTMSVLQNQLSNEFDSVAIKVIITTINALTAWAKNTAFLVPPPFCANRYWYDVYGNPINHTEQTPIKAPDTISETECNALFEPVCDTLNNITYVNECEAVKAGAIGVIRTGSCFSMVRSVDRGNLEVTQRPTDAIDDNGQPIMGVNGKITLPNILQAEYFNRLYYFMARNINRVPNVRNLADWAVQYLITYNGKPPTPQ